MDKTDITRQTLCIKRIISVIKGENTHHHKLLTVNGRHSDAFVYVLSGECDYQFDNGTEFKASAGDVFYLPHKAVYTMYIRTGDYRFIFCDLEFDGGEMRRGALYPGQELKNVGALFEKLYNKHRTSSESSCAECMALLYSIYGVLQQSKRRIYLDGDKRKDMLEARRCIDEGFKSPSLSISALAEQSGISEVYFRRLFKAHCGLAPSRYLLTVRLENAKRLMQYPFLTLEECALQSGFSSLQYFCRVFKKENGISPGRYRSEKLPC